MFAICPLEVEAKVRPFLKNAQLFVSSQWIPYLPAESYAFLELGGVGWEEVSREEWRGKERGHSRIPDCLSLTNDFVQTWENICVWPSK